MYLPGKFAVSDETLILEIVRAYPFATVMSYDSEGEPYFSHIPVLAQKKTAGISLLGHVSKANSQWRHFAADPRAKVIVHGPNSYITPNWYRSGRDVPTWNYVAIHFTGTVRVIEEFPELVGLLQTLTAGFEKGSPNPWEFYLPDDLLQPQALCAAIVGFEIATVQVEAKFKLGQNRPVIDKVGVIEGLSQRKDDMSHAIRDLMIGGQ